MYETGNELVTIVTNLNLLPLGAIIISHIVCHKTNCISTFLRIYAKGVLEFFPLYCFICI